MFRKAPQPPICNQSTINRLLPLAGLLATALSTAAFAQQSQPFPTYSPGENINATTGPTYAHPLANPWVVSDGTIITPAGTQVYLGITTRAKEIAVNPTGNHTAAVLQMGAPQAVTVFNTQTGAVLQTYSVPYTTSKGAASKDSDGSQNGIAYTPDGKYLLFSQDGSSTGASYVAVATVNPRTGLLSNYAQVPVPLDVNAELHLTNVTCYPYTYNGPKKPASGSPGAAPRAALKFLAASLIPSFRMTPSPRILWASRSRRMPRRHMLCWTTTTR